MEYTYDILSLLFLGGNFLIALLAYIDRNNKRTQSLSASRKVVTNNKKAYLVLGWVLSELWVWQTKIKGWNQIRFQPKFLPI